MITSTSPSTQTLFLVSYLTGCYKAHKSGSPTSSILLGHEVEIQKVWSYLPWGAKNQLLFLNAAWLDTQNDTVDSKPLHGYNLKYLLFVNGQPACSIALLHNSCVLII